MLLWYAKLAIFKQSLVCTLCFPNKVHVIFIRTVFFNFHLSHGHLMVWFLKEQEAHFIV